MSCILREILLSERMSYTTKEDIARLGFYFHKQLDNVVCCECGWSSKATLALDSINFMHKITNPHCGLTKNIKENYDCYVAAKNCVLETETAMINTFQNWPKRMPKLNKLVAAGFYYTGEKDEVACIACGVLLHEWEDNDDPWIEHELNSPDCELIKIKKSTSSMYNIAF